MKLRVNLLLFAAMLIIGSAVTGCNSITNHNATQADTIPDVVETYLTAVDRYLTQEIAPNYAPGEICIPVINVVDVNEQNPDSILVWGDFWVFNYNLAGDTLKTVSGGDHPGLMCVKQTETGFEVIGFDRVVDGAGNIASAKRIFGDKYGAFFAANSDENKREQVRAIAIAKYVKDNALTATLYQDYGWPVKPIPLDSIQ